MRWRVALPLVVFVLLLFAPGCQKSSPSPSEPAPTPSVAKSDEPEYIGTPACAPCHAELSKIHGASRHMQTLRPAIPEAMGNLLPALGKVPGTPYRLKLTQGRLSLEGGEVPLPLHLVFGSGKTGITFATSFADGTVTEMHKSYFVPHKTWYTTPGQEDIAGNPVGLHFPVAISRKCVLCHAVTLPPDKLRLERRFVGVGCEACHGPGSAHVAAAEAGKPSKALITGLKAAPGSVVLEACGKCHRTAATIPANNPLLVRQTQRFQPYGLSKSRCFKLSQDKLSCVTCHDPHQDASTDHRRYEKTCLSCHSAPKKACPVNPKEKCISCHMPQRQVFEGTEVPTTMSDHFIRVYKDGKPTR